jgi:esterase/lipase superfamily enzyme
MSNTITSAMPSRPIASARLSIDSRSPNTSSTLNKINAVFATNRKWVGAPSLYSADFLDPLHGAAFETGSIDVYKTGAPASWIPDLNSIVRHPPHLDALVNNTPPNAIDTFLDRASPKALHANRTSKSSGLVFIHGFNTSFVDVFGAVGQIAEGYGHTNVLSFCWRNYPPPTFEADARRWRRVHARAAAITAKGFAPLSLAVSTVVRTSASAWAAHMAR